MKKERLEKAKEILIENIIEKVMKGEITADYYNIINSELFNIERKDKDSELNRSKKELAELMSKTLSF